MCQGRKKTGALFTVPDERRAARRARLSADRPPLSPARRRRRKAGAKGMDRARSGSRRPLARRLGIVNLAIKHPISSCRPRRNSRSRRSCAASSSPTVSQTSSIASWAPRRSRRASRSCLGVAMATSHPQRGTAHMSGQASWRPRPRHTRLSGRPAEYACGSDAQRP